MGFIVTHFNTKRNGFGKYEFIQISRKVVIDSRMLTLSWMEDKLIDDGDIQVAHARSRQVEFIIGLAE